MKRVPLFSVVIPYYNRPRHIEMVLKALEEQDFPRDQFEIVISTVQDTNGAADPRNGVSSLNVRRTESRAPWNVSRARNRGFAVSNGEVLVLLDADMLIPRLFLRDLRDHYNLESRDTVVLGQMLNYSAYTESNEERLCTYEHYRRAYLADGRRTGLAEDVRWNCCRSMPWSLCWTALVAIPRRVVIDHDLQFDETFNGWGAEDLEWGYRVSRNNIPLEFADELWGIHLPHVRNVRKNCEEQERNYGRFLRKWPCFEVELVTRFGEAFVNEHFEELMQSWCSVSGSGRGTNVLEVSSRSGPCIIVGAVSDFDGRLLNCMELLRSTGSVVTRRAPLLGVRLPYEHKSMQLAYLLESIDKAPDILKQAVRTEAARVAKRTVEL